MTDTSRPHSDVLSSILLQSDSSDRKRPLCDGGITVEQSSDTTEEKSWQITIENLGGISNAQFVLPPGASTLVGRNATNRSSACQAIAAALGGETSAATLRTDADEGSVKLSLGDKTYTKEYTRMGQSVKKRGETYAEDADLIDTFVALFVDSPARRAVEQGEDLRNVLMKPVDTAEIKSRISALQRERADLDETIQKAERKKANLPKLEEDRTSLVEELEEIETEISELRSKLDKLEPSAEKADKTSERRSELEGLRSELNGEERRLDEIQQQLEFRRNERETLVDEQTELQESVDSSTNKSEIEQQVAELEAEIDHQSSRYDQLNQAVEDLQSVIQANETLLEEDIETFGLASDESVTSALDPDSQTVECWTCGTMVEQGEITARLDSLRQLAAQHRTDAGEIEEELTQLRQEKSELKAELEEFEERSNRLEELEERIEQHRIKVEELESEREEVQSDVSRLRDEIEAVETEIQQTESEANQGNNEFVEAHKRLTELERERGRLENKISRKSEQIEQIEVLEKEREQAEAQREQIAAELEELRGKIDQLETDLVETLNSIMEDLVDRLEYTNIARVWLERQVPEADGASSFELHIVRESEDGTVYEDSIATLSESEREVIGLVVALAGYLVHDVDQAVPFLILDSVEMIDGERLAHLLEYINSRTEVEYLSIALLPKDAEAVEAAANFDRYSRLNFEGES